MSVLITDVARGIVQTFSEARVRECARAAIADISLDAAKRTAMEIVDTEMVAHIDAISRWHRHRHIRDE